MRANGPILQPSLRADGDGCTAIPKLLGHTVAITGDRRSDELAAHLRSLGADIIHGPMVHTRPIADDDRLLRAATESVLADPPDYLLATTGIGIRGWINAAASWRSSTELLEALASTQILARGPKVVGSLSEAGLAASYVAESGHTSALVDHLLSRAVRGAHVALQLPGEQMDGTIAQLEAAGVRVTAIPVYEWTAPDDLEPARRVLRAIVGGRVAAVVFTSRPAVREFAALAGGEGLDQQIAKALRGRVLCVCIGPSTADALRELTGAPSACPERAVLGALGPVVADELHRRGHHHLRVADGSDVVVQGRLVDGRGTSVMASDREGAVLNLLISRPIRTVGRAELARKVWRAEVLEPSVLDNTVLRLRRRLRGTGLAVATVSGRGYLLNGEVQPCPCDAPGPDALDRRARPWPPGLAVAAAPAT